ncbi:MAG: GH1 family beta-glucosidase [Chloroflexaceae bacterium]|nr:GH1 family beta-glucosidase [Chloroflexaceae bacterium]
MSFPGNFTWGVATASYQIEGSPVHAGGGPSVWDLFCRREGAIVNGESGAVACDHYRDWRDDVALMRELGLKGYRFSISWSRVIPNGTGAINQQGLDFYDRLVDALLEAGIQPWVTLFHWDYPAELYYRGGWLNRASADWFADYTQVVVDRLSDRVQHWMTLNEPQCFVILGHQSGYHAPGLKLDLPDVLRVAHHSLLAHGRAVQVIRARSKTAAQVGFAPVGTVKSPATDTAADIAAAQQSMFSVTNRNLWNSTWWLDPVFLGSYPEDGLREFAAVLPAIRSDDMATIQQPLDFFGANIYHGELCRAGTDGQPEDVPYTGSTPRTLLHWPVVPQMLYWGPKFYFERYGKPIVITENGCAQADVVSLDGRVHDPQRIDFLNRYLRELGRAAADGVTLAGYFQWSLLDNFEWAEGYRQRFGLVYTDYATQRRIPKDSAAWYAGVIRANGVE